MNAYFVKTSGVGRDQYRRSGRSAGPARIFLDRLMRLPDLKLQRSPDMTWCDGLMSYELRGAMVTCVKS